METLTFDKSVLENMPIAIGIVDFEGNIHSINQKFKELFGYTIEDIPNIETWAEIAYPDKIYREEAYIRWTESIEKTNKTNEFQPPQQYIISCKNNEQKNIEISFGIKDKFILTFFRDITELSRTKKSMASEKKLSSNMMNSLPGIFYVFEQKNDNYYLIRWNENFEKVTGYNRDELKNKTPFELIVPTEHEKLVEAIEEVFTFGHAENELLILTKNKEELPFLLAGTPFEEGENNFFLGFGIDISKQKETEKNLTTIFQAFPDIIIVTDYNNKPLYVNKALEDQTGYTIEYLQENSHMLKLHPDEDNDRLKSEIKKLINSNKSSTEIIENRFIDKNGKVHWYSGVIAKTSYNNNPALITISRNITKTKYSEKALIESEKRMSAVFDSAPVIMMLINEKREILQINKKGITGLKYNPQDSDAIPFGDAYRCINSYKNPKGCGYSLQCTECVIRKTIQDTFDKGIEHTKVEATIHTQKDDHHILLSSSLLKEDYPKEGLITIDDITARKRIENDLKLSKEKAEESDRLKSAFLQNISHEIRTPLNGILGFTGLLHSEDLSSEERDYYIEVINQSSAQLVGIVDDILSISRLETGQIEVIKEEVNINTLLQELFTANRIKFGEKNIILSYNKDLNDKQSAVYTDENKLKQILDNLLSNALKFTPKGHVLFGYRYKIEELEFYVEDTGIGIKPEYHEKIFKRFQQLDFDSTRMYGGTGLGLTIAKGNSELLGGRIWLESKPDIGSKFFFTIPYYPVYKEVIPEIKAGKEIKTTTDKKTILIAEDEEINYLFIYETLKDKNYNLVHVYDGIQAVEQCKTNDNIVLVLLDIKMPNMDGYKAFEIIKELRPELPVIAQTAYAMITDREKAMNMGFTDYLAKPIKSDDLLETIIKYIPLS